MGGTGSTKGLPPQEVRIFTGGRVMRERVKGEEPKEKGGDIAIIRSRDRGDMTKIEPKSSKKRGNTPLQP